MVPTTIRRFHSIPIILVYTEDASTGLSSERVYYFDWDWESYSSICMRYSDGLSYMDNVSLGQNKLDCKFDGDWVTFIGK